MHLLARANKRNHKSTKIGLTCSVWALDTLLDIDMSPKCKDIQWIQRFPSLRCLAPPESCMGYWEKIGNIKSEQRKSEQMHSNKQTWACLFPSEDMWLFSSLNTKHLGPEFSPLLKWLALMWSLSPPLTSISRKGSSRVWVKLGLVLESQSKAAYRMWFW